jgi:hypothetical protein
MLFYRPLKRTRILLLPVPALPCRAFLLRPLGGCCRVPKGLGTYSQEGAPRPRFSRPFDSPRLRPGLRLTTAGYGCHGFMCPRSTAAFLLGFNRFTHFLKIARSGAPLSPIVFNGVLPSAPLFADSRRTAATNDGDQDRPVKQTPLSSQVL